MISQISGVVAHIHDTKIILINAAIGFEISCPTARKFSLNSTAQLYTYLHWSQENGPSLYGFETLLQKDLFLLIIDCQGIGPKLGISILEQTETTVLISMITEENMTGLNKIKGLGSKKAETLCLHLKNKIPKLIQEYPNLQNTPQLSVWNDIHETLSSLNYSNHEIRQATSIIKENLAGQNLPFDLLLRKTLMILAKK